MLPEQIQRVIETEIYSRFDYIDKIEFIDPGDDLKVICCNFYVSELVEKPHTILKAIYAQIPGEIIKNSEYKQLYFVLYDKENNELGNLKYKYSDITPNVYVPGESEEIQIETEKLSKQLKVLRKLNRIVKTFNKQS